MNRWVVTKQDEDMIVIEKEECVNPIICFNKGRPVIRECPNYNCDGIPTSHKNNSKRWRCPKCKLLFSLVFRIVECGLDQHISRDSKKSSSKNMAGIQYE